MKPLVEGAKIPKSVKRYDTFEFVDSIKGGVIPQEFIPAVEKGVKEGMERGVVAGFPLVNLTCELTFGSYHDVDSSEIAYKIAGSIALQEAAKRAKPVLLEPIMVVEVVTPEKFLGDVTAQLSSKRAQIESVDDRGNAKVIKAQVPLAEMFGYITTLRSLTEGRANFSMEFSKYDIVPQSVALGIIEGKKSEGGK